jgi:hypothetical protein
MSEIIEDDPLDRQLREAVPYIDDAGFTAQVLSKLPAPRRQPRSLRGVILIGIALLGSASAYVFSGGGKVVSENVAFLASLPTIWLLAVALVCGLLVTTGGLFAALSKAREMQS